jgi:hypothetical protein
MGGRQLLDDTKPRNSKSGQPTQRILGQPASKVLTPRCKAEFAADGITEKCHERQ